MGQQGNRPPTMAKRPSSPVLRIVISIPHAAWLRRVPDARARCRRVARAALLAGGASARLAPGQTAELSLVLGDDTLLRKLNREYRGQDKPTNVLSFAAMEAGNHALALPVMPLGDVAIAFETTVTEARQQGKALTAHLSHLVAHGVLHLLGYDHLKKAQADEMETLETALLSRFGLSDPYRARVAPVRWRVATKPRKPALARRSATRSSP